MKPECITAKKAVEQRPFHQVYMPETKLFWLKQSKQSAQAAWIFTERQGGASRKGRRRRSPAGPSRNGS
jgi:hypothetical protein